MQQLFLAERLEVIDCPLLKENGAKGGGSEWSRTSHVLGSVPLITSSLNNYTYGR
jgi:hypothetical protein